MISLEGVVSWSEYQNCVCLPVISASVWSVCKGLNLRRGQGCLRPLGLRTMGGITLNVNINVMSCARRSNVQMVLSGKQLVDRVQMGLF